MKSPFFAAADTHAYKFHPQFRQLRAAPPGILKIGIAAVNDNIALLQQRSQRIQHGIHRRPRLDHQNDLPGPFQILHQLFQTVRRLQTGIAAKIFHKLIRFGCGSVKNKNRNIFTRQVSRKVSPHNSQTDQADFCFFGLQ